MGSGLSSAVLRRCAAELGAIVEILSVDDSAEWLEKTRQFLAAQGLDAKGTAEWAEVRDKLGHHDLVLFDLGNIPTREAEMAYALRLGSTVILDDMHRRELQSAARQALSQYETSWALFDLTPITHDSFKRFAWAVVLHPEAKAEAPSTVAPAAAE